MSKTPPHRGSSRPAEPQPELLQADVSAEFAALRHEIRLLRETQALARTGSYHRDLHTGHIDWSDEQFRLFGYAPGEVTPTMELVIGHLHPDDRARFLAANEALTRDGGPYDHEYRIVRKDGEVRHVRSRARLERDVSGRALGFYGAMQDVTDRKRAEALLRDSEAKFRAAFEQGPNSVLLIDGESGQVVDFNDRAHETLGYTREEFARLRVSDFEAAESPAEVAAHTRRVAREGADSFETQHRTKDGRLLDTLVSVRRIDLGGRLFFLSLYTDITERKCYEEKLREHEELLRYIVEHDPNAIAVYDRDLRYIFVSQRYLNDYRVAEADIIGKHHYEVFPEMPQRWKDVHQRVLGGAVERADQDWFERPDGSVDYNRWECRPWYRPDGTIGGMITYTEVITERKRAELALRESEERFRTIIENLADGVFAHDQTGRLMLVNKAACRNTGYTREELLSLTVADIDPDSVDRGDAERMWATLQSGASATIAAVHRRKDGSTYPCEVHLNAIMLDGQPAILGVARDVSERHVAEQALRASEARYRKLYESVGAGVLLQDADGRIVHANDVAAEILDMAPAEIEGRTSFDPDWQMVAEDGTPVAGEAHPSMVTLRTGEPVRNAVRGLFSQDRQRMCWLLINTAPLRDDDGGERTGVLVTFTDITRQRATEDALRRNQEFLKRTGRMARIGGWEVDVETQEVVWTDETYHIHELPVGQKPSLEEGFSFVHPEDRAKLKAAMQRAIDQGEPYDMELRFITAKGNHLWTRTMCTPQVVDGKTVRLVGAFQDITQTHELEEQLRQAQKMEAIGQLAGGVAHDFNNILTAILGNVELPRGDLEDRLHPGDPVFDGLHQIATSGQRAADLTRQLLAFSRKQLIKPEVLDPCQLARDMEKMLRRLIREDIELRIECDKEVCPVRVDRGQIEQVVLNLVVNAKDAMPKGGALTIRVSEARLGSEHAVRHADARPGRHACIMVRDSGAGMDQKTLQRIFEPFFTTKRAGEGTGLGLATVHGIVRQSNGHIVVHSEPGAGSTFEVYLPAVEGVVAGERGDEQEDGADEDGGTVLLCEDDDSVRGLAVRALASRGYAVLEARDAWQALEVAARHANDLDLLITDVIMPGMNGRELAEALLERHAGLRVLYISGYAADVIGSRGILEEGTNFLEKPFSMTTLLRRVRQTMQA